MMTNNNSNMKSNSEKNPPKGDIKYSITLSEEQKLAKYMILERPVSFIMGHAGSGKTLLAVQVALDLYFKREVDQIVITRPTISTEDNGFLPGSLKEKMEEWLVPIRSNMLKVYNKPDILTELENKKAIELVSLSHFRGRTFEKAVCIVDEFQNLTRAQLQMCIGRLGKDSRMLFTGDAHQIDLKIKEFSAVYDLSKIEHSKYVNKIILSDNHRHEALSELLNLLNNIQ